MLVGVFVVGLFFVPAGGVSATASAAEIHAYVLTHRRALMVQVYLLDGVAGVLLLVFAAALRAHLGRPARRGATVSASGDPARGESAWGDVVFGAGVAAASVAFAQAAIGEVLAGHVAERADATLDGMLFNLVNDADTFRILAMAVMIGTAGALAFGAGLLPRPLTVFAVLLAAGLAVAGSCFVVNVDAFYPAMRLLLPLTLLWILWASIHMFRAALRAARATPRR